MFKVEKVERILRKGNDIKSKFIGKMKTKWEGQFFFRKKSKNTVRWSFRLSSAIWWWVMAIWKLEICATPTAYAKFFWEISFPQKVEKKLYVHWTSFHRFSFLQWSRMIFGNIFLKNPIEFWLKIFLINFYRSEHPNFC